MIFVDSTRQNFATLRVFHIWMEVPYIFLHVSIRNVSSCKKRLGLCMFNWFWSLFVEASDIFAWKVRPCCALWGDSSVQSSVCATTPLLCWVFAYLYIRFVLTFRWKLKRTYQRTLQDWHISTKSDRDVFP